MIRRPPGATRAATRLPYTTLFRSPACRRYPVPSLIAASRPMIAVDIVAGRPPYRLATGVAKAKPHHDIIGVGAKRLTRADPRQRQIAKEAIQIGIIASIAASDQRHISITTSCLAALATSNNRNPPANTPPPP